ncbi:MAG: glycosyltransferase [Chloroflexi bacterium]|nr:glycosyltransferase [Chloroflexota bacterium]
MLSIAIPTYRRPQYLAEALESVAREAANAGVAVEVVVQDNASGDSTEAVATGFPGLSVSYACNEDNLGPSENIVRACERCTGDYIFLLGDDDLLEPGSLARVNKLNNADPKPGTISGPVTHFVDEANSPTGVVSFQNVSGSDQVFEPGGPSVEHIFLRATMLSGLIFRRDLLDAEGARKHADSLYPQIYLAGVAGKQAGVAYTDAPIVSVRDNPFAEWSYSGDYMARGVFRILDDLTEGAEWGPGVKKRIAKRRVRSTYNALYTSRQSSFGAYAKTVRGLWSVRQYRRSPYFWAMTAAFGILGVRGIGMLRRVVRMRASNRVG